MPFHIFLRSYKNINKDTKNIHVNSNNKKCCQFKKFKNLLLQWAYPQSANTGWSAVFVKGAPLKQIYLSSSPVRLSMSRVPPASSPLSSCGLQTAVIITSYASPLAALDVRGWRVFHRVREVSADYKGPKEHAKIFALFKPSTQNEHLTLTVRD